MNRIATTLTCGCRFWALLGLGRAPALAGTYTMHLSRFPATHRRRPADRDRGEGGAPPPPDDWAGHLPGSKAGAIPRQRAPDLPRGRAERDRRRHRRPTATCSR